MQVFVPERLAYLAVPKTGSSAYEAALRPFASIDIRAPIAMRHMTAQTYLWRFGKYLANVHDIRCERVAVLRDPIARLASWYRYRQRDDAEVGRMSTTGLGFDEFLRAILSDDPPPFAKIGRQDRFCGNAEGRILVEHLFTIEEPGPLQAFLSERIGQDIAPERLNVSPRTELEIEPATEKALRAERASEFALYDRVAEAGHLVTKAVPMP